MELSIFEMVIILFLAASTGVLFLLMEIQRQLLHKNRQQYAVEMIKQVTEASL